MELIDKNKLLEELEELKQNLSASPIVVIENVESLVESLEVKEVNFEKVDKNLKMLLDVIDYSFLQTDGSYDKSLTYPVIDKVLFIKKSII